MKPTRARTLLLIIVLAAAVTWALLDAVYASLPPLTWTGVPALLIAAGAEAWLGRDLRARIQGFMRKLLHFPERVRSYFQHPCVQYAAGA